MRCPVGPPMPGVRPGSAVPASGSALMYMRGTPMRLPASAARAAGRRPGIRGPERGVRRRAAPRTRAGSRPTAARARSRRASRGRRRRSTSSTSSRSAIVRVCGTTTSIVGTSGQLPRTEMTPREGVYAQSALFEAGARPVDQVSSPSPNAAKRRRGRGARAVRRARAEGGGEVVGVVRALGAAVDAALHAAVRHRRHVREADEHRAGGAQPLDRERVALRDEVLERGRPGGGGEPAHEVAVLRGVRDAVERTERLAAGATRIGCRGLGARVGVHDDDRVERGRGAGPVVRLDAREVRARAARPP